MKKTSRRILYIYIKWPRTSAGHQETRRVETQSGTVALWFSALGKARVFLTRSFSHTCLNTSLQASAIKNIRGLRSTVNVCPALASTVALRAHPWVSDIPAKKKGRLLKKKDSGGVAERRRGAQHAWHPKVRSEALWHQVL